MTSCKRDAPSKNDPSCLSDAVLRWSCAKVTNSAKVTNCAKVRDGAILMTAILTRFWFDHTTLIIRPQALSRLKPGLRFYWNSLVSFLVAVDWRVSTITKTLSQSTKGLWLMIQVVWSNLLLTYLVSQQTKSRLRLCKLSPTFS